MYHIFLQYLFNFQSMKKKLMPLTVLLLAIVVAAAASFFYQNSEKFRGFLRFGGGGQPASKVPVPWWCMSQKDWEDKQAQFQKDWEEQKKKAREKGKQDVTKSGSKSGDVKVVPFTLKNGFVLRDVYDISLYLTGGASGFALVGTSGSGLFSTPGFNIPVNPPEEEPLYKQGSSNPSLWYNCSCDQKEVYVSELGKSLKCPDFGSSITGYYEGSSTISSETVLKTYFVVVWKPTKAECDPKWSCPSGYVTDYEKVKESCSFNTLAYKKACRQMDSGLSEVCGAFHGAGYMNDVADYSKSLVCVTKDQCARYSEWAKKGVFTKMAGSSIDYKTAAASCVAGGYGL